MVSGLRELTMKCLAGGWGQRLMSGAENMEKMEVLFDLVFTGTPKPMVYRAEDSIVRGLLLVFPPPSSRGMPSSCMVHLLKD